MNEHERFRRRMKQHEACSIHGAFVGGSACDIHLRDGLGWPRGFRAP